MRLPEQQQQFVGCSMEVRLGAQLKQYGSFGAG
jgi:hypothetical protein